jgi:hypothetical protein
MTAAAFLVSPTSLALAGTNDLQATQQQGALAPGNAASVHQAQENGMPTLVLVAGALIVAGGICVLVCSQGHGHPTTSTTSTAP